MVYLSCLEEARGLGAVDVFVDADNYLHATLPLTMTRAQVAEATYVLLVACEETDGFSSEDTPSCTKIRIYID